MVIGKRLYMLPVRDIFPATGNSQSDFMQSED
jgi:hypothetical protein